MKTIKFRAWDKERDKMYEVDNINFKKKLINVFEPDDIGSYCSGNVERPFKFIELMQFTGLQDKNGKDIYEGDILAPMSNDFQPEYKGKWLVGFRDGTFIAKWENGEESHWLPYWSYDVFTEVEVIGNIHENKELL